VSIAVLLLAFAVGAGRHRFVRRVRRRGETAEDDLVLLGDLMVLGLLAGMTFTAALDACAAHVNNALGDEIKRVTRAGRLEGSATAFADTQGALAGLLTLAARAATTGAPMVAAIAGFTTEARNAQRARALENARRLSVRLLFPLALLILPGFVLLVAGPVVLDGMARFDL
jgi:tight adherence protein C